MFIEVTDISNGPILLNLNYVVQIYDASSMGGGCIIYTTTNKIRLILNFNYILLFIMIIAVSGDTA